MLDIQNLFVKAENKEILKGISLEVKRGEIHVIMGPNGAGKTSFAMSLLNSSKLKVESSKLRINGEDISKLKTDERIKKGLFVSFQNPIEVDGISFFSFLRASYNSIYPEKKIKLSDFKKKCILVFEKVGLNESFLTRYVNVGFSGGEKKKTELVQLLLFCPKFAVLDEIDSGLDIDTLKKVFRLIKEVAFKKTGIILITHNSNILNFINPTRVHILIDGEIKNSGKKDLIEDIEKKGFKE